MDNPQTSHLHHRVDRVDRVDRGDTIGARIERRAVSRLLGLTLAAGVAGAAPGVQAQTADGPPAPPLLT